MVNKSNNFQVPASIIFKDFHFHQTTKDKKFYETHSSSGQFDQCLVTYRVEANNAYIGNFLVTFHIMHVYNVDVVPCVYDVSYAACNVEPKFKDVFDKLINDENIKFVLMTAWSAVN